MTTLQDAVDIGRQDRFLAVVSTLRADATIQSSVVNAGVLSHPVSGEEVVVFVTAGKAKLANLRDRPQVSITFRSGWQWATVEGRAEIIGPDDGHPDFDPERIRLHCFATCFRRPGVPMTTGMPTTMPWPRSDGLPCLSAFRGSTAIDPSESDGHARLSFVLSFSG